MSTSTTKKPAAKAAGKRAPAKRAAKTTTPRKPAVPAARRKVIEQGLKRGDSVKAIAAAAKCSRGTIRRAMRELGLAPAGRASSSNMERDAKIAQAVKDGQTVGQVA
jgi:DNA invertase Pin-like site-specific DNA recombinase